MLGGADRRAAAPRGVPDRRHPQAADPRRGRPPRAGRRRQARQPRHLLHPVGDTRAFLGARIGVRRGAVVDAGGAVLAEHDGVHGFTIGQRKGLGIAGPGPDGQPRYVTGIDADTGTVHVGDVAELDVWTLTGERPVFTSGAAPTAPWSARCRCARTAASPTPWPNCATGGWWSSCAPRCAGGAGQTMVLYRPDPDGDEVIGSATITRCYRSVGDTVGAGCSSSRCRAPNRETRTNVTSTSTTTSRDSRARSRGRAHLHRIRRRASTRRRTSVPTSSRHSRR